MSALESATDPVAVGAETFIELLRGRADRQPGQRAYTFLADGLAQEEHLSYGELDRWARAIAVRLQELGATGERAILLFQPGLQYVAAFFGCLYAGVVAVPAYPPRPNRSLERLEAIVEDGQIALALSTAAISERVSRQTSDSPTFAELRWVTIDEVSLDSADDWEPPEIGRDALAFLQYTSGSTSHPKGVMLTHGNLLANMVALQRAYGHTRESQGVVWVPPYHDMGLIGGILQPCYVGFPVVLMAPVTFLQRPFTWLNAISRYRASTSAGPNFAYELCTQKITPEQRATLDLSSWAVAINGAEPVRAATLRRFSETFGPAGFRATAFCPSYGLAESTLIVSSAELSHPPRSCRLLERELARNRVVPASTAVEMGENGWREVVSCGRPAADHQVRIVDPERLTDCGPDEIGEIWVSGPSVAQGYWGRPEESAETFTATRDGTSGETYLRTGDLGFLRDGELYITGRLKDLIIIDGRNHYPHDLELTVERSHPLVRPHGTAAFAIDVGGEERLVVVAEAERRYGALLGEAAGNDPVKQAIRQAVAEEHDLRVHAIELLKPGGVLKTSSGKIRRSACRAAFLTGTLDRWDC